MDTAVLILIPAAGSSRRMGGRDKLLELVAGTPLLHRQTQAALATGLPVLVTLPPDRPARTAALAGLPAESRILPDAAEGMAASLRAGALATMARQIALLVLPADMPEIDTADLLTMLAHHKELPHSILRGSTATGIAGHPVILPVDLLPAVARLHGDTGARSIIAQHAKRVQLVPLPGQHALIDLDTPEAWAEWRAQSESKTKR